MEMTTTAGIGGRGDERRSTCGDVRRGAGGGDRERRRAREEVEEAARRQARPAAATPPRRPAPPRTAAGDDAIRKAYAALEVPAGSDFETVRKSYRRLMRKYHPDLHGGTPEKSRAATEHHAAADPGLQDAREAPPPLGRIAPRRGILRQTAGGARRAAHVDGVIRSRNPD